MPRLLWRCALVTALLATAALPAHAQDAPPAAPKPAALIAEGVPPIPLDLVARTRPYLEARAAGFAGWDPTTRAVLIQTRFGNTVQLHRVAMPMGARTQIGRAHV